MLRDDVPKTIKLLKYMTQKSATGAEMSLSVATSMHKSRVQLPMKGRNLTGMQTRMVREDSLDGGKFLSAPRQQPAVTVCSSYLSRKSKCMGWKDGVLKSI